MTIREWVKSKDFPILGNLVLTAVSPEMLASVTEAVPLEGESGDALLVQGEDDAFDLEHTAYSLNGEKVIYVSEWQEMEHPRLGRVHVPPGWYLCNCFTSAVLEMEVNTK
jgi:hypothetical protein